MGDGQGRLRGNEEGWLFPDSKICDPRWKNRPLVLKHDFAVGGSILDSTLFIQFFSLDILKV